MTLAPAERSFYFVGGSLPRGAASYIRRRADEDLLSALLNGEFCYILTSRQMGKSSLMIHTVMRLQERGVHTGVIDLTSLGQNLEVEQWYRGMLNRAAVQLDLEDELDDFWHHHDAQPPLERWISALQHVVLKLFRGTLVIFIDEIDMVRSLPFPTDEFFAGIRACFNRRDSEPELERLTFCLLGAASPSDLIDAGHITPFNVGKRIELHDFTLDEASVLSVGISGDGRNGSTLLQRAVYWTGGHPYLTQRLCATIADHPDITTERDVDVLCDALFFSHEAIQSESNLAFVRNCILKSGGDILSLLDLYSRIYSGKRVYEDPSSPICDTLRLSGIVSKKSGILRVRNRIYERVFNAAWIRSHIPVSELHRHRLARRKGFLQATLLFGAIAAVIGTLGCIAYENYRFAVKNEREARYAADKANSFLYIADMNLAQRAWEATPIQVEHVKELLAETRSNKYRGFVWGYWNRLCHLDLRTLSGHTGPVNCVAVSADGKWIATGSADHTAKVWELRTGREMLTFTGHSSGIISVAFKPDGRHIVTQSADRAVKEWDARTGREDTVVGGRESPAMMSPGPPPSAADPFLDGRVRLASEGVKSRFPGLGEHLLQRMMYINRHAGNVRSVALSKDSEFALTASADNTAEVWDVRTGRVVYSLKGHTKPVNAALFSPDGKTIVTGSDDNTAKVWAAAPGQDIIVAALHIGPIASVAFSPDGQTVVVAGNKTVVLDGHSGKEIMSLVGAGRVASLAYSPDGTRIAGGDKHGSVRLWDAHSGRPILALSGERARLPAVAAVAFSPDSRHIVTGCADHTARIWDAATGKEIVTLVGHTQAVQSAAFSPDGKHIVTGSADRTIIIWNAATGVRDVTVTGCSEALCSVAFSSDSRYIVAGSADNTARLWEARTGKESLRLTGHTGPIRSVAYSPDGERVLTGSDDGTVKVWNSHLGKEILTLKGQMGGISSAAFSPQYDRIVAGSHDGSVRLWFSDSSDLNAPAR